MNGLIASGDTIAARAAKARLDRLTQALRQVEDERDDGAPIVITREAGAVRISGRDLTRQLVRDGSLRTALGDYL